MSNQISEIFRRLVAASNELGQARRIIVEKSNTIDSFDSANEALFGALADAEETIARLKEETEKTIFKIVQADPARNDGKELFN